MRGRSRRRRRPTRHSPSCGLLTGMLAARLLGAEGRGQLAAAQAWPLFLATLGSFGLTEAIAYFVARDPSRARTSLATGLLLSVPFTLVAVVAGVWLIPRVLRAQTMEVQQVATLCLVLVPLLTLSAAPSQALRGVGRYRAWNVLRLFTPLAWLATLVAVRGTDYATVSDAGAGLHRRHGGRRPSSRTCMPGGHWPVRQPPIAASSGRCWPTARRRWPPRFRIG